MLIYHELPTPSDIQQKCRQNADAFIQENIFTFVIFIVLNTLLHWKTNWEDNKNKISISEYWMTHVSHDIINGIYRSFENNVSLTNTDWLNLDRVCYIDQ